MKETIVKINETFSFSWFFEKIKLTGLQPDSSRKEENQINKIRNDNGEVSADNTEIQREIKKFLETNDNENTVTQTLWDIAKAVLGGKFIAIQSYLKK